MPDQVGHDGNTSTHMIIDQNILDSLTAQAKASPQLRMNMDLRNSPEDKNQQILNALAYGTMSPIHRRRCGSETSRVNRMFFP